MRAVLFALLGAVACSGPEPAERTISFGDPSAFAPVSEALHAGCGTLDCHGSVARNLRIYGENGLRLRADATPGGGPTTPEEHGANYQSVTALEPELLEAVMAAGGERPERLTLVRKARGVEDHDGDDPFPEASSGDRCLVGWLSGEIDVATCGAVVDALVRVDGGR